MDKTADKFFRYLKYSIHDNTVSWSSQTGTFDTRCHFQLSYLNPTLSYLSKIATSNQTTDASLCCTYIKKQHYWKLPPLKCQKKPEKTAPVLDAFCGFYFGLALV